MTINTLEIYRSLQEAFPEEQANQLAEIIGEVGKKLYEEFESRQLAKLVTKDEFRELREIVTELAEAQKRTEEELRGLAKTVKGVQKELGGLSNTVGYTLENQAYKALPALLLKDQGIQLKGRLIRKFFDYPDGRHEEINIFGEGKLNGKELIIIGESKAQLSKKHVDRFIKAVDRIVKPEGKDYFKIMVTHMCRPGVVDYCKERDIAIYLSYEF